MSFQPIVLNIQYTPYRLPKNATPQEIAAHENRRAFFDMTGGKNIFDYITTDDKQKDLYSFYDYLQKTGGVFNDKGRIFQEPAEEMKERLRRNEGNIYHGFISLNKEESHKIDSVDKCIEMIKRTFPSFLSDARFNKDNIDLMCALHTDRPNHLHIHFVFWEKEPKYLDKDGNPCFRRKSKIEKRAINNFMVRLGLFLDEGKETVHKTRDEAIRELRGMTSFKALRYTDEEVITEILALAKELPEKGRLSYGSKDMEPFRGRVDKIVAMLLATNREARKADADFHQAVEERRQTIKNICGKDYAFSDKGVSPEKMDKPTYRFQIDEKEITMIDDLENDYKRRQGNLIINLAKAIKPEYYERKKGKKYKASCNTLKKSLTISRRNVNRIMKKFFSSFGRESRLLERDFSNRLHEIEEEMKKEREQQENQNKGRTVKNEQK